MKMSRFARISRTGRNRFSLVEIMIVVAIIGVLLAVAIPNFAAARRESRKRACIANLREMDGAKDRWAIENGRNDGDSVTFADLVPTYLRTTPVCPSGGTYTLGVIGTVPTCTIEGHVLEEGAGGGTGAPPSPMPAPKPKPKPNPNPKPSPKPGPRPVPRPKPITPPRPRPRPRPILPPRPGRPGGGVRPLPQPR